MMVSAAPASSASRLALPEVTLCAVTSINVEATVLALEASLAQVDFAACKLFTDAPVKCRHPGIDVVPVARLASSAAYSDFLLSHLVDHVETGFCLVAQWDGHVLNAARWCPEFLAYDYIGASWPQFDDGHDVGNGGFSLRSRRLMAACRDKGFNPIHPEDIAIGRTNRLWLEGRGMRFAPRELADQFATERRGDLAASFGYHGVWNMPRAVGPESFWRVYKGLDDRGTVRHDFASIVRQIGRSPRGLRRVARMMVDRVVNGIGVGP